MICWAMADPNEASINDIFLFLLWAEDSGILSATFLALETGLRFPESMDTALKQFLQFPHPAIRREYPSP